MEQLEAERALSPEEQLAAFQEEIAELKREEERAYEENKERGGVGGTGHFLKPEFQPSELTEEDREVWEHIKSGDITREEFEEYRLHLREAFKEKYNPSRSTFASFIANKVNNLALTRKLRGEKK